MKIGVIGAGNIGSTLGRKWAAAGHILVFGVRNPFESKYDAPRSIGVVTTVGEAVKSGEVIVLALPGAAVADFAAEHGASLAGKLVIDTTNNVRSLEMHSLAVLATNAPGARLARAFSTLGWENFANPQIGGIQIDLFFCAQPAARPVVESLIQEVGLRPVFLGDLDLAPAVDGMTRIWFALAFGQNRGRRIAFKMLAEN
jgi:predicted dinucleotide-binding enzyme